MIKKVSANYSHWPLLFIMIPLLLFMVLRNIGVWVIIGFLTPITQYFDKVFTQYQIKDNKLIIRRLFSKQEIPLTQITSVENKKSSFSQRLMTALPQDYQIVKYNAYDEIYISPQRPLIHDTINHTFYFKN